MASLHKLLNFFRPKKEVVDAHLMKRKSDFVHTTPLTCDHKERALGCNIIGHIYAPSGRGEDARTGAMAASAAGIPFTLINTFGDYGNDGKGLSADSTLREKISRDNPYDINIFYINADEMHHAYEHLGESFYKGKYNIGYWAWELREFPDAWLSSFDLVDEIWAQSRFTQDSISQKTDKPVVYMPLVVSYAVANPLPRTYFQIPEKRYVFLTFFDFTSYFQRKNPFAVVEAFQKAFNRHGINTNVQLVVKLNNWDHDDVNYKTFEKAISNVPNIQLVKKVFADEEMKALVNCCDCFVSLHRSEGFGRGPAEAMALKKPVIVSGYSGNMDYCNESNSYLVDCRLINVKADEYPHGEGQIWADADVDHAAFCMTEVFLQPESALRKAETAHQYITTYQGPDFIGKRYARRLKQLTLSSPVASK